MISGSKLREYRLKAGMTQTDLIVAAGYPKAQRTLSDIELGQIKRTPAGFVRALCRVLFITIEDLGDEKKERQDTTRQNTT